MGTLLSQAAKLYHSLHFLCLSTSNILEWKRQILGWRNRNMGEKWKYSKNTKLILENISEMFTNGLFLVYLTTSIWETSYECDRKQVSNICLRNEFSLSGLLIAMRWSYWQFSIHTQHIFKYTQRRCAKRKNTTERIWLQSRTDFFVVVVVKSISKVSMELFNMPALTILRNYSYKKGISLQGSMVQRSYFPLHRSILYYWNMLDVQLAFFSLLKIVYGFLSLPPTLLIRPRLFYQCLTISK